MPFNIQAFISQIDVVKGMMPASKFEVRIFIRNNSVLNRLLNTDYISFFAFSADIPGINSTTENIFLNGYGRVNEIPVRPNISECDIEFYMDESNTAYELFYTWISNVINLDGNNYKFRNSARDSYYDEVFYATDYYADVVIDVYGNTNKLFSVQLLDAFPLSLTGIGLDWNNIDLNATGEVKLCFRSLKISFASTGVAS